MGEQIGTSYVGTTAYSQLFKSSKGPDDVISANLPGATAAVYTLGQALINSATAGMKAKYTNATAVADEAVATGDASTVTFSLDNANVIAASLKVYVDGVQVNAALSAGTGAGGVDQVVCNVAPGNSTAIKADYSYHATARGVTGACVLMKAVTTTSSSGNVSENGCRDGSVDSTLVLDANGVVVDEYFRAALPNMTFD